MITDMYTQHQENERNGENWEENVMWKQDMVKVKQSGGWNC